MADLHILREHALGLPAARKIALQWAEQVESEFDMECTYEKSKTSDVVTFVRSGVHGTLHVSKTRFELNAKLGFLMGVFKHRIEAEIVKNLDALLAPKASSKKAATKKT